MTYGIIECRDWSRRYDEQQNQITLQPTTRSMSVTAKLVADCAVGDCEEYDRKATIRPKS